MRTDLNNGFEYEYEAQLGLPSALPKDEKILWQGSPDFWTVAKDVFFIRVVIVYFLGLILLGFIEGYQENQTTKEILFAFIWMCLVSTIAISLLTFLAHCTCRTTIYTITNRRVVMRIGVVLTKSFNLPLTKIESADIVNQKSKIGNIAIQVESTTKIAAFHLWPHARPWRFQHPEPMLLGIKNVDHVSNIFTQAWSMVNLQEVIVVDSMVSKKMPEKIRASEVMPMFGNKSSNDFVQI